MEPGVKRKQILVFRKFGANPQRGEIIFYDKYSKTGNGAVGSYLARVIGLPGESVRAENGNIYLKNNAGQFIFEEDYLTEGTKTVFDQEGEWFRINSSQYFVLADKRDGVFSIADSLVEKETIKGILLFKF